jgi:hypothetical protein
MNAVTLDDFIVALRSGKYEQIAHYLRIGDCFCAEGVLCDLLDPDAWYRRREGHYEWNGNGFWIVSSNIPEEIHKALGYEVGDLAYANDVMCLTFAEIADELEAGTLDQTVLKHDKE